MNAAFYESLLSDPEARNRIDTTEKCDQLISEMESVIPHDELPKCYDWLVARRDSLR